MSRVRVEEEVPMLNSLMNAWRSRRGRRPLDVLDVIAEADAQAGVSANPVTARSA